jgi:hypothetical protein
LNKKIKEKEKNLISENDFLLINKEQIFNFWNNMNKKNWDQKFEDNLFF